jgi:hypothetical protein
MKTKSQQDLLFKILRVILAIENKGQFEVFYNYSGHVSKVDVAFHLGSAKETNCVPTWGSGIYLREPLFKEEDATNFIQALENILKNGADGIPDYDKIVEAKKAQERTLYNQLKAKFEPEEIAK